MSTALVTQGSISADIERVLIGGDLSKLNPDQRISYYNAVCRSLGLNPLTGPFDYVLLNNRLVLYAKRDCTDQLRKIHKVSIKSVRAEKVDDLYVVVACAEDTDGRTDQSTGVVNIEGLKGEKLANAMMKAETKSKRRVTLSICGLGMLDEVEVQDATEDYNQDQPPQRAPVSQPKRASEKQTEQPKAETQPVQEAAKPKGDGTEVFGGVIQPPMRSGKENCQWMHVMTGQGAKLIVMSQEKVAQLGDDLRVGAYLTVKGLLNLSSKKVGPFYEVTAILENPPEAQNFVSQAETEEVIDAEFEEVPENMDAEPPEETPTIEGLKSAGVVTTASNLPPKKTIGIKRAQRIYTIASQNAKTTGLTEEKIKQLLAVLPTPLEHLRDLPVENEKDFERFASGEDTNWQKFIG